MVEGELNWAPTPRETHVHFFSDSDLVFLHLVFFAGSVGWGGGGGSRTRI